MITNSLSFCLSAAAKSLQSCPTLCDPRDGSPPGFPVPGILQARTLEWVAISFSNAWKWRVKVKSLSRVRLVATLMDCSPPGSSIHGIFQARVLEWGAIAFSVPSSQTPHNITLGMTLPFWKIRSSSSNQNIGTDPSYQENCPTLPMWDKLHK